MQSGPLTTVVVTTEGVQASSATKLAHDVRPPDNIIFCFCFLYAARYRAPPPRLRSIQVWPNEAVPILDAYTPQSVNKDMASRTLSLLRTMQSRKLVFGLVSSTCSRSTLKTGCEIEISHRRYLFRQPATVFCIVLLRNFLPPLPGWARTRTSTTVQFCTCCPPPFHHTPANSSCTYFAAFHPLSHPNTPACRHRPRPAAAACARRRYPSNKS